MMVVFKHLITKKVDATDNLTFFFEVSDRPKGMFQASFVFTYKDGQTFKTGIEAESLTKEERILHKKDKSLKYGFFPIVVPRGVEIVQISFGARYGTLGQIKETTPNLVISTKYEDVTKFEELYENRLKKLL